MTIAKSVFRRGLGDRLKLTDLVRKDRQSVSDHVAADFFEGGLSLSFGLATIKNTPSVIYITGINEAVTLDTATLILTPDTLWSSDAMMGRIRMVPSPIYIKGINESVVLDTATLKITPSLSAPLKITTWAQLIIEGSLHCGPAPPLHQYYGSIFRRSPSGRLALTNLVQWNKYDDTQPKPVAAEFWEPGMGVILATPVLHLTGTLSYAGIDASVTLEGTIRMVPESPSSVQASVVMEGRIFNVPIPMAIKESAIVSALNIDVTVSRSMVDPVSSATFNFDGDSTGGEFSGIYNKDFLYTMPDYLGVERPVFVGFFPSSRSNYGTVDLNEQFTAFDNGWYLTEQYLEDNDLSLLSPTNQTAAINNIYRLEFIDYNHGYWFQVGDRVIGMRSGDAGTISEINSEGMRYLVLKNCTHGDSGNTSDDYFQDAEELTVNDYIYCFSNGHTMNITGMAATRYPHDRVRSILGGDDWANKTGIEPYRIADTSAIWGGTRPAIDFINGPLDPKIMALQDMAQYLGFMMEVKPRVSGSWFTTSMYFIPQEMIDDPSEGLDLPAPLTVTSPNQFLDEPVVLTQDGGKKYNKITVWCQLFTTGGWVHSTLDDGNPRTIEFAEIAKNISTQDECNQRCADLWEYNHMQIMKWQAVFIERPDLQKYQKIIFSGYGAQIPDGTYRIIDIQYPLSDAGTTNLQQCTLMLDSQFGAFLNLNRVFTDSIKMVEALIQNALLKLGKNEAGTVISNVDGKVITTTEFGQPRIARDITGGT